jgi:hypothetical protein
MKYTVFSGCSYTAGVGLLNQSSDSNLWVNILHSTNDHLKNTKLINVGKSGINNRDIFLNAVDAISTIDCKFLFVSWTELFRLWVDPGTETYTTKIYFGSNCEYIDVHLNNGITYSADYIKTIKNRLYDLYSPHYHIVEIVNYTNTLKKLCDKLGIAVFFLNALATEWDLDYFDQIIEPSRTPSMTTKFTQHMLNAKTRDDDEYFKIYDRIHQEYSGINQVNWLNLYQSYRTDFFLDKALDNLHPGINSNQAFATFLSQKLQAFLQYDN